MISRRASKGDRSAYGEALRRLARRPSTRREIEGRLEEAGYPSEEILDAVGRLRDDGYLDDAALSLHYLTVRSERNGHGRDRLIRELERRGVEPHVVRRAWDRAVETGEVEPERILLREADKRVVARGGSLDRRGYARVYNALLRLGHEPGRIHQALSPYAADPGAADEDKSGHDL